MNYYLLWLTATGFDFASFEEDMNHINLLLLLFNGLGQRFSFLLVLAGILFMLLDALFIFVDCKAMLVIKKLNLPDQIHHFFLQLAILALQFLISESGWLDIFGDYFLNLHYLLNYLLDLYWSLDVDRFNSNFSFDFPTGLKFVCLGVNFFGQFAYRSSAL